MGDNSEDQCAISGRRAYLPEKILKDFVAIDIIAGDSHNIAVSEEGELYSWGGTMINSAWISSNANESKLRLMDDLKRRKINTISLAYKNTLVITGQKKITEEKKTNSKKGLFN
jgi:alpha-tubulin suppressor-like RCC1 family protein